MDPNFVIPPLRYWNSTGQGEYNTQGKPRGTIGRASLAPPVVEGPGWLSGSFGGDEELSTTISDHGRRGGMKSGSWAVSEWYDKHRNDWIAGENRADSATQNLACLKSILQSKILRGKALAQSEGGQRLGAFMGRVTEWMSKKARPVK